MKKKINVIFPAIMALTAVLCAINVTLSYFSLKNSFTSFPPETAFIYIIPYSIAILLIGLVWLITHIIIKKKNKG